MWRLIFVGLLYGLVAALPSARADEGGVDAARNALQKAARFPWYNRQSDEIQPVSLPPEPPLRRPTDWERKANSSNTAPRRAGAGQGIWQAVQYAVWLVLAILFACLVYLWIKAAARHELNQRSGDWDEEEERRHESDSIEQLPFQVKRPQADLLAEAKRFYLAHDDREAIIYLFSYQLVQLDRHQRIQLAKGKTNRQYLQEVRSSTRLRQLLMQTMLTFEDVFFGDYELDRERFDSCWHRLDEFDELVRQTSAAPS